MIWQPVFCVCCCHRNYAPCVLFPAVSDPSPSSSNVPPDKRSFVRKLIECLIPGPDSQAELYNTLSQAEERQLIEQQLVDIIDHVREIRSVRILESRLLVEREDPRDLPPPHA